jgi:hypothetical protein
VKRPTVAGLVLAVMLLAAGPARAYDDGGDYGNGNDQRRCHRSEGDCRGSFSPGPFDRSPIDFSNSCISLDCSGREKDDKKKPPQEPKGGVACLVPVPFHCDQPAQLTNPAKLPAVIQSIVKSGFDLGKLFADGTITFVEDLFQALA